MISRILLAVLGLGLALVLIFSDRPWSATSMPRIAEIETLPEGPQFAQVREYAEYGSGILPYMEDETPPAAGAPVPLRLGWVYREFGLLRMPFWAKKELGPVIFYDRPEGVQFAAMMPAQLELLEEMTGKKYSDYGFPFYRYLWGWLFVIGVLTWFWLNHRATVKWREQEGII